MMMGSAHVMGGKFDKAAVVFRRAIELNPKLPLAHSHLGKTLLELGERDEALREFARETAINPTDFDAQFFSGVVLREQQQWQAALEALGRARKIPPKPVSWLFRLDNQQGPAVSSGEETASTQVRCIRPITIGSRSPTLGEENTLRDVRKLDSKRTSKRTWMSNIRPVDGIDRHECVGW